MDEKIDNAFVSSIAPWFPIDLMNQAVDFYKKGFGATEVYRLEDDEGSLMISRLSINGAEFWINQNENDQPVAPDAYSVRMILTVENPHAVFEQALQAGATEIFPVGDSHGWRIGRLVDPFGYHWEIGRPLEG